MLCSVQQNAWFDNSINFTIKYELLSRKARVTKTKLYNIVSNNFIFKMSAPLFFYIINQNYLKNSLFSCNSGNEKVIHKILKARDEDTSTAEKKTQCRTFCL